MTALLDSPLQMFGVRIDEVRNEVTKLDTHALAQDTFARDMAARVRASAYVWVSAALERFVKDTLTALIQELNLLNQPVQQLRLSACSLVFSPDFESLRDLSGLDAWLRRVKVLERIYSSENASFNEAILPLDGRTIKTEHLESIWTVFGFDGPIVPHPRHKLALRDLAESRNKLAHGEIDPARFGRLKPFSDVLRMIEAAEDVGLHINQACVEYLSARRFAR